MNLHTRITTNERKKFTKSVVKEEMSANLRGAIGSLDFDYE
jgi:hypothetical protein